MIAELAALNWLHGFGFFPSFTSLSITLLSSSLYQQRLDLTRQLIAPFLTEPYCRRRSCFYVLSSRHYSITLSSVCSHSLLHGGAMAAPAAGGLPTTCVHGTFHYRASLSPNNFNTQELASEDEWQTYGEVDKTARLVRASGLQQQDLVLIFGIHTGRAGLFAGEIVGGNHIGYVTPADNLLFQADRSVCRSHVSAALTFLQQSSNQVQYSAWIHEQRQHFTRRQPCPTASTTSTSSFSSHCHNR